MTEAVKQNDDDRSPPTWADMREHGGMVVDKESDKLAVYVGGDGHVVVMFGPSEHAAEFVPVHCSDVPALIKRLTDALPQAVEDDRQAQALWEAAESQYEAHVAQLQGNA